MCESCQAKINLITRKLCSGCNRHFCQQCVSASGSGAVGGRDGGSVRGTHRKSPHLCRRCTVFGYPVMERGHLDDLSLQDLKQYKGIDTPLNGSKDAVIQLILGHQARILTERAQKAISQLNTHQIDVLSVEPSTLQPPSTAYSSGNGLNGPTTGSVGVTQTTTAVAADIRSRVKKQMDLRKNTEVLDTSGITTIEELSNEAQIDALTVRQLKMILQRNCIDYHGCVEKTELMERVHRLYQDRLEQKEVEAKLIAGGDTEAEHDYLCKVCMDSAVDCVFLNCGHMLTCVKCGRQLTECPVCRQYIVKVIHAFRV